MVKRGCPAAKKKGDSVSKAIINAEAETKTEIREEAQAEAASYKIDLLILSGKLTEKGRK